MKLVVRKAAQNDLDRIFAWIAKDNPRAAIETIGRIQERIGLLRLDSLAEIGRPGLLPGTRELIESRYIIVYRVHEERGEIVVLSIIHAARHRPRQQH